MKYVLVYKPEHPYRENVINLDATTIEAAREEAFVRVWLEDHRLEWCKGDGPLTVANLVASNKRDGQWEKEVKGAADRSCEDPEYLKEHCLLSVVWRDSEDHPFRLLEVAEEHVLGSDDVNEVAAVPRGEMLKDVRAKARQRKAEQVERLKAELKDLCVEGD